MWNSHRQKKKKHTRRRYWHTSCAACCFSGADNPSLVSHIPVTVQVLDVNDNPPEIATDEEVIVCESSRPGQVSVCVGPRPTILWAQQSGIISPHLKWVFQPQTMTARNWSSFQFALSIFWFIREFFCVFFFSSPRAGWLRCCLAGEWWRKNWEDTAK